MGVQVPAGVILSVQHLFIYLFVSLFIDVHAIVYFTVNIMIFTCTVI